MDLKKKVVFITGASQGIGRAIAESFAKEKCWLVLTYRSSYKEGLEVEKSCQKLGAAEVMLLNLDLMDDQSIMRALRQTVDRFGQIDILVNNAGYYSDKHIRAHKFEEINRTIRTNLEGLIKLTVIALPEIKDAVINISSQMGLTANSSGALYSASKWGVRGFTQSLALEESRLRIFCVNPRGTATRMNDFTGDDPIEVAKVVVKVAKGQIDLPTGSDINVWDYLESSK